MNYVGKFDATISSDGPAAHSHTYVHVDHLPAHAPADAILVPDAQLLFNGDFTRSGVDLILSKDDREFVLHDYFKGEKRAALASPDGAHLTGDLVNALTGEVQVSQAGGPTNDHQVIGHVSKLQGSATAIRNGVSIILNNGDNVEKGDVVQSGSDSTLGVTFIDGTVFGLSSNARMVLNEMVYDPNGSNNSSLLSLVAGTITFVAGETAKHGDMKIDTPVATMGIRGTAVLVEIDFTVPGQGGTPDAKFQVLVEPDGTTGSYILFDKTTLQPIAMVNLAGQQINISNGVISQSSTPLSPDVQKLITDVFSLKFSDANTNTKTTTAQTDTLNPELVGPVFKLADGTTATPIFLVTNPGGSNGPSVPNLNGGLTLQHIDGPPKVVVVDASGHPATGFGLTELPGKTGDTTDQDTVIGKVNFVDINPGDTPTAKVDFSSFVYQNAQHQNLTLNALQQQDIAATEIKVVVVPDPGNNNNGNATWTYSIPDNAFDFLAAGETLTLTYNVRVDNNYTQLDEFTIIPITITITGTNDAPVITSSAPTIAFAGGTNVSGGNLPLLDPDPVTGTKDATSGTLSFKDVDLTDTHTVSAALTGAVGVLNGVTVLNGIDELPPGPFDLLKAALTASIGTDSTGTGVGTINWNLANLPVYIADFIPTGEKLTLTYTVTLTDSQGATTTQDVTVTIGGTNAPAVVWIDTTASPSGGQWNVGTNWETGLVPTATEDVIIITDQLIGLTPVYPVTIDSDIAAVANSLTMNDFGPLFTNSPKLVNQGTLTVGLGGVSLKADSIIENDKLATISVAGLMEVLEQSSLQNYGKITIQGGGDFKDQSTITNFTSGTIEVSGGTLNVLVDIANSGSIAVDSGATLALSAAAIDGGTVTINGTLELDGGAILKNGSLGNSGQIKVSGTGNALDGETVTNNGAGAIDISGALTLLNNASISNAASSNAETVEIGASLTLQDTSHISGGLVTNKGTLNLQDTSALESGTLTNTGQVNVSGTGNTLDGETVTNNGTAGVIDITGALTLEHAASITNGLTNAETVESTGSLTLQDTSFISGGAVINEGTLNLQATSALKSGTLTNTGQVNISGTGNMLDGETVTNNGTAGVIDITGALTLKHGANITNGSGNAETVESTGSLTLQDTSFISGGAVINEGTLNLQATSALESGTLTNTGKVNVSGTGNTLDGETVTNNGTAGAIDINGALTLLNNASISNAASSNAETVGIGASLTLQDTSHISGGTVSIAGTLDLEGTSFLQNGILTNTGQVNVSGTGNTFDGETLTNNGVGAIDISGVLTLLDNASISNVGSGNAETVEKGASLTLQDTSSISGGKLTNLGHVYIEASLGATFRGVNVDNTGGTIQVDASGPPTPTPATLILDDGTAITGGIVNVGSAGILDLENATINGSTLSGVGKITTAAGNADSTLNGVTVDNGTTVTAAVGKLDLTGTITNHGEIDATTGVLDLVSAIINGGTLGGTGTITTATGNAGSTLNGVTVHSGTTVTAAVGALDLTGTITNNGEIDATTGVLDLVNAIVIGGTIGGTGTITTVTGNSDSKLNGVTVDGGTKVTAAAGTLDLTGTITNHGEIDATTTGVLDLVTAIVNGGTLGGTGTITTATGNTVSTLNGVTVDSGTKVTAAAGELDLTGTITNHGEIDATAGVLDLVNAIINGGTLGGTGTVHVVSESTIADNATLDSNSVTVDAKLTLDDVTVSGSAITDNAGIKLDDTVKLTGGATIQGQSGSALGAITNLGTLEVAGAATLLDDTLTNTGHVVQVDDGQTLTLSGTEIIDGTVNDYNGSHGGTIHVTGASRIDGGATLNDGAVTVDAMLTLDNVTVSGSTITDKSSIEFDDTVKLTGGATIQGQSSSLLGAIVNLGTLEVAGAATLLDDTLTNTGHIVQVDSGQTLDLDGSTINGGTLTLSGTLDSTGVSFITGASIDNTNNIEITGGTLTIDPTPVTNTGTIWVTDGSTLVLSGETVANSVTAFHTHAVTNGTIQVDAEGSTLDLEGSTIDGGIVEISGLLDSTGISAIEDANISNTGTIESTSGVLTIDPALSVTLTNSGMLEADRGALDITGEPVTNTGTLQAIDGGTLKLTALTVDNISGTVTVASGSTLDLAGVTIDGGTIIDNGTVDVTGSSAIDGTISLAHGHITTTDAILNGGTVTVENGATLTLDDVAVTSTTFDIASGGTLQIDGGTTLTLSDAIINGGTTNDYSSAFFGLFIVDASIDVIADSAIDHASLNNGNVTIEHGVTLTMDNDTVTGTSFTDAASGSVQIDGGTTLTLSGAAINGGIIDDYSLGSHGSILAGDIDVTGYSAISNASLNNGNVTVEHGVTLELDNVTASGTNFTNTASGSVIQVDSGITELSGGSITNDGTLEAVGAGSKLVIDDQVTGTGSLKIFGAATLEFVGLDKGEAVTYAPGSNGTLEIDTAIASHTTLTFGGEIYGVGEDNNIDLADLQYSSEDIRIGTSFSHQADTTTLTVTNTQTHQSVVLDIAGQHSDWDFKSDGHGGVEISDPPADSATLSVDSGATLDLGAASAATVTFLNSSGSTGSLALDQPSSFTGLISGFTGDGTLAGSDQIDLKGINYNASSFSQSYNSTTDTLSLSDGTNSSILHFVGTYQAANFSFASDGNGGTIVYDPPVLSGQAPAGSVAQDPGPAPSQTIVASAPSQILTGLAASDNFVFNFANVGHGAVTNFHPATDTLQFASPIFANAQAALNATHDDGLGNTVVTLDGHDTVTLSGVVKAQLHVTDFHVV